MKGRTTVTISSSPKNGLVSAKYISRNDRGEKVVDIFISDLERKSQWLFHIFSISSVRLLLSNNTRVPRSYHLLLKNIQFNEFIPTMNFNFIIEEEKIISTYSKWKPADFHLLIWLSRRLIDKSYQRSTKLVKFHKKYPIINDVVPSVAPISGTATSTRNEIISFSGSRNVGSDQQPTKVSSTLCALKFSPSLMRFRQLDYHLLAFHTNQ